MGTGPARPEEELETMTHVRFEAWTLDAEELTERRRRLMMGMLAAATLSMTLGLTSWTAERLGISRVDPPKNSYAVTLQLLEPPPPPSPPPPPAGVVADDKSDATAKPDDPVPPEPEDVPTEVLKIDLDARPQARVSVPTGIAGGGGGTGTITGIPGGGGTRCALPPCIGTQQVIGRPNIPQPKPPAETVHEPIERVMASSVFTPDPDQSKLARTTTGLGHRRPGRTTVSFCIDGGGKTYDVRVKRRFPGDDGVDEICRATVARWRFSPQRVGGKARSTCSSVTFDIRFE
jgi:protein TonB